MRKRLIAFVFCLFSISLAFAIDIDVIMSFDGVTIGDTIDEALLVLGTPSEVSDLQDNQHIKGIIYSFVDHYLVVRNGIVDEIAKFYPYRPSEEIRLKKEIESVVGIMELVLDEEYYFLYQTKIGFITVRFRRDNDKLIVAIEDEYE